MFRLFFAAVFICFAFNCSAVFAQKLHAVVVADDMGFPIAAAIDTPMFCKVLKQNIDERQLSITAIAASSQFPSGGIADGILQCIKALRIAENKDTVLFYYTGHGALDVKKTQVYTATNRQTGKPELLFKNQVIAAIGEHKPKLTVIISDCCSVFVDTDKILGSNEKSGSSGTTRPLFRKLFFDTDGIVDFCAAQDGKPGWAYPVHAREDGYEGSILTCILCEVLRKHKDSMRTWNEIFNETQQQVRSTSGRYWTFDLMQQMYQRNGKQLTRSEYDKLIPQEPLAFMLDGFVFGLTARGLKAENGVLIDNVLAGSAADKAGFEKGDVITEIDGKAIHTPDDYSKAVDAAGRIMRLKVRDRNTGNTIETEVNLPR